MKATLLLQVESHLLKLALVRLYSELKALSTNARIVASVHDSIWVEATYKTAAHVRRLVRKIMMGATQLLVPLEVEIE